MNKLRKETDKLRTDFESNQRWASGAFKTWAILKMAPHHVGFHLGKESQLTLLVVDMTEPWNS